MIKVRKVSLNYVMIQVTSTQNNWTSVRVMMQGGQPLEFGNTLIFLVDDPKWDDVPIDNMKMKNGDEGLRIRLGTFWTNIMISC